MNFQHLEIWQVSRELRRRVFDLNKGFPESEKFRLADQIIRYSRSVTAKLAEGIGRFHYQEGIQFCRISRGSLAEALDHLTCSLDCGYVDRGQYAELEILTWRIYRLLNGYIGYLNK